MPVAIDCSEIRIVDHRRNMEPLPATRGGNVVDRLVYSLMPRDFGDRYASAGATVTEGPYAAGEFAEMVANVAWNAFQAVAQQYPTKLNGRIAIAEGLAAEMRRFKYTVQPERLVSALREAGLSVPEGGVTFEDLLELVTDTVERLWSYEQVGRFLAATYKYPAAIVYRSTATGEDTAILLYTSPDKARAIAKAAEECIGKLCGAGAQCPPPIGALENCVLGALRGGEVWVEQADRKIETARTYTVPATPKQIVWK